jgi:hypothetical protein
MKFSTAAIIVLAVAILSIAGLTYAQKKWNQPEAPAGVVVEAEKIEPAAGPAETPAAPVEAATEQTPPVQTAQTQPAAAAQKPASKVPTQAPVNTTPEPLAEPQGMGASASKMEVRPITDDDPSKDADLAKAKAAAEANSFKPAGPNISYVYERPTLTKFSQLYWTLGKLDLNDPDNIDYFLMINECDIYKEYVHNEFEWKTVRDAARKFLSENKSKFSLRYEIIQPLQLGEYHVETERFDIVEEFQVKNTRRFEVFANDYDTPVCNYDKGGNLAPIPGYPRGILVELTRPIMLTSLPVDKLTAHNFVEEKLKAFKALNPQYQSQYNLYSLRDAYLVMKIKLFAYRQEAKASNSMKLAEVLGILEGIEIYSDRKKKKLLYVEDYRRKKQGVKSDPALRIETLHVPLLSDDPPELRQEVKLMQQGQF